MRNEDEMYDLIINTAKEDARILAVYMNGSRTNANAPKDIFQDYDIVYVVEETESFIKDKKWIDRFGERLFMQYPEEGEYPSDKHNFYGWLIQFADGNRLDLHVETVSHMQENILADKLCRILLDKNGILPEIPEATDEDYWVKKPGEQQFLDACNEFWWCLDNVAKGLWRGEIPYVQEVLNGTIRPELVKMLSWKVGITTDFSVCVGKSGKYLHRWLTAGEWQQFLSTYTAGEVEDCWVAVEIMCSLMDRTARYVGEKMEFSYNIVEAENCRAYLKHVRKLAKDAVEIYG